MTLRAGTFALLLVATELMAPLAHAEPKPGAAATAQTAATHAKAEAKRALEKAVDRQLAEDSLQTKDGYRIDPSLVQLRKYVDPSSREVKIFCVVDLALSKKESGLFGSVRGTATVSGGSRQDAMDGAVRAAVHTLPDTVLRADRSEGAKYAQR